MFFLWVKVFLINHEKSLRSNHKTRRAKAKLNIMNEEVKDGMEVMDRNNSFSSVWKEDAAREPPFPSFFLSFTFL